MKKLFGNIYRLFPFKKELWGMLKTFYTPPPRIHRHLHFHGTINVRVPGTRKKFKMDHFGYELENDLFWNGLENSREKESVRVWSALCKKASVIVDAGANTGVYSLLASTIRPAAKIYAFEPVERIHARLRKNIQLNNFDIQSFPLALSDYTGKGFYHDPMTDHFYSITVNRNTHVEGIASEKKTLQTITLDQFVKEHGTGRINLMKLDVETHEPQVIRGYSEYLRMHRPDMIMEVLGEHEAVALHDLLSGCGYVYYDINETTGLRPLQRIQKSSERNILVCTKESAEYLELTKA